MDYKIKYLKYKKKYLNLKKMDNNSYKYFTLNNDIIEEVIPQFPDEIKNKVSPVMVGASITSFNKFNRKLFKTIQSKSREEAIQEIIDTNNTSHFRASAIYSVYEHIINNFDSIDYKYITKQTGGYDEDEEEYDEEEYEEEEYEGAKKDTPEEQPWYCDMELKVVLESIPIFPPILASTIIQFICGKKLDGFIGIAATIISLIPFFGPIAIGGLSVANIIRWWIADNKRIALEKKKALEEEEEEEEE